MGQVIGPIPRHWWKTFKDLRDSMMDERANGNLENYRMERRSFWANMNKFVQQ